jgi:hypothetical protein
MTEQCLLTISEDKRTVTRNERKQSDPRSILGLFVGAQRSFAEGSVYHWGIRVHRVASDALLSFVAMGKPLNTTIHSFLDVGGAELPSRSVWMLRSDWLGSVCRECECPSYFTSFSSVPDWNVPDSVSEMKVDLTRGALLVRTHGMKEWLDVCVGIPDLDDCVP